MIEQIEELEKGYESFLDADDHARIEDCLPILKSMRTTCKELRKDIGWFIKSYRKDIRRLKFRSICGYISKTLMGR